ncbi:MAG: choice-of-anchor J domain-containing protein [Flavobacteriales bacterium]|nr:choice-of-anchor J domain-containing protein [Flavobacteriales bacterium]
MRHLLLVPFLLGSGLVISQDDMLRCLANNPAELQAHLDATPGARAQAELANSVLNAQTAGFERGGVGPLIIPVVFHVIHNHGAENIDDAQLVDAIRILNEDYNKENPDWVNVRPEFLDLVADVGIEFRLAKRDPEGNCTNGITRTVSTQTYNGDFNMTQLIQWPRDRYMNVWVAASANGAAGYTYYPSWLDGWAAADGIVVLHSYTGSIGTSAPYKSRVLSHEVGHWLNLKHCWGDSNDPGLEENCAFDDEVDDTPLTKGWTSCTLSGASCGSPLDNVQNYMEYSYCCKMFTHRQGSRMVAALTSPIAQRNNLWQLENLALTGVLEEELLCMARFDADHREVCAGDVVQFSDESYFGVTQRFWSFPGGAPAGSFDQDPAVIYDEPGVYPVTLNVGDGITTETVSEVSYITVLPNPGRPIPWSEGFESVIALPNVDWRVDNPDNDLTFESTSAAAYTGSQSCRIFNNADQYGRIDALVSSTLDMSAAGDIALSFRYAYARRNPVNDDQLYVYVSNNCGQNWTLRKVLRAITTLVTANPTNGNFVPNGPSEWGFAELTNIGASFHTPSFRVKFEFQSNGGNNLYLDDININNLVVGIEEQSPWSNGLAVVPNPIQENTEVRFHLDRSGTIDLDILDVLGRTIRPIVQHSLRPAGDHRIALGTRDLVPGTYLLRLRVEGQQQLHRFIVL